MGAGVFSALDFSHVFILMLLSSFIFKYKITKGKILSLSLAVVGMVMVLNVFSPEAFISPVGLLWIAVDWFCNCAIALLLKWALNNEIDNDVLITYYNLGAALIYWTVCPPWGCCRRNCRRAEHRAAGGHHCRLRHFYSDFNPVRLGQVLLAGRPGHHQYDGCLLAHYRRCFRLFYVRAGHFLDSDSRDRCCHRRSRDSEQDRGGRRTVN